MRFAATSLVAIVTAVLAVAQPLAPALSANVPQTNAERLAAGLPPLPPKSRLHSHAPRRGSKVGSARRALASPSVPINTKCIIRVGRASNNEFVGYISPRWSTSGIYGLQSIPEGALEVSLRYSLGNLSQIDMVSTAISAAAYPYIGAASAIGNTWDLLPNAFRYSYITGTARTLPGSPPVQSASSYSTLGNTPGSRAESAIWKYDPVSGAITAQWVNPDGTLPATYLAYAPGKLLVTGDPTQLRNVNGVEVTFTCLTPLPA